jgi:hypothetical protein
VVVCLGSQDGAHRVVVDPPSGRSNQAGYLACQLCTVHAASCWARFGCASISASARWRSAAWLLLPQPSCGTGAECWLVIIALQQPCSCAPNAATY